jgi:hypothetical protein
VILGNIRRGLMERPRSMHAMNGTMRLASSGTRLNHRNKRNFSRINFDQDDRFLCPTSGPIKRSPDLSSESRSSTLERPRGAPRTTQTFAAIMLP